MKRRVFVASAAVALTPALTGRPIAQVRGTRTRIGWVTAQHPPSVTPFIEAFRDGLSDVGYTAPGAGRRSDRIGARLWHSDIQGSRRLEIYEQLRLSRLLDRQL